MLLNLSRVLSGSLNVPPFLKCLKLMTDDFGRWANDRQARIETFLESRLPATDCVPELLHEAMRYSVLGGGKRVRPLLAFAAGELAMADVERVTVTAAAVELIHAYSLVHDDLPCMDDDDLRRGQPTVHKAWDEATAVLVGDALQALAFDLVADTTCSDAAKVDLMQSLARAAGVGGMVGGQAIDIAAETSPTPLTLDEITALQAGKTGALITWSASSGARMAEANTGALEDFGDNLGLAFQIWDDVLDVEGNEAVTGKAVGKDAEAGKATFVSLLGLDGAKIRAKDLVQSACDVLSVYGDNAETLRQAAQFVISRTH